MSTNHNYHIHSWLEKIEANIAEFKAQEGNTPEDEINFITHQYHLVMLIGRALNEQVIFTGAKPIVPTSSE